MQSIAPHDPSQSRQASDPAARARRRAERRRKNASRTRAIFLSYLLGVIALIAMTAAAVLLTGQPALIPLLLFVVPAAVAGQIGGLSPAWVFAVLDTLCAMLVPSSEGRLWWSLHVFVFNLFLVALIQLGKLLSSKSHDLRFLQTALRGVLENDRTGIVVLNAAGKPLHVSREAVRICGSEIRDPQGIDSVNSSVRFINTAQQRLSTADLMEIGERAAGSRSVRTRASCVTAREMMVIGVSDERNWIECCAVPLKIGRRAPMAVMLLFWDNQARRRAELEQVQEDVHRKRREEREELFQRLGQNLRSSLDAHQIQLIAVEELGKALSADRCFFLLFRVGDHRAVLGPQWNGQHIPEMLESYQPVDLDIDRLYRYGVTRISHDMRSSSLASSVVSVFEETLGVRSAISIPIFEGDKPSEALVVATANAPRAWTSDEVALAESVASQSRFVIEAARLLAAERSRAEREEMSNKIGMALRNTADPRGIQSAATSALGRALQVDRCYYVQYDLPGRMASVGPDYARGAGNLPLTGDFELPSEGHLIDELVRARDTIVVDGLGAPDAPGGVGLAQLRDEPIAAFVRVPIFTDREATAVLIVTMTEGPRVWTPDEIALVESVAAQTCSAIMNAQILAREHARAERKELVGRIALAIAQAATSSEAQRDATSALGAYLHADRCYRVTVNAPRGVVSAAADYHRQDLPSLAGEYPVSSADLQWLFDQALSGAPLMISDLRRKMPIETEKQTLLARHRSLLVIPQVSAGRVESMLMLASVDRPREWSSYDCEVAQDVTLRMQASFQAAHNHERERRIAHTLQEALLPSVPDNLPGLKVAMHYCAALQEASVGGDFFDAFALSEHETVICVGDVSDKGPVAAAQVSTLRNMLRANLYRDASAVRAMEELNRSVTKYRLLNGFATAFVGIYNSDTHRLSYVSCGQEPALLLRAAGGNPRILSPTAVALGVLENEKFDEGMVTLASGDHILLYTDGVSEAGEKRSMLGVAGLAQIALDSIQSGAAAEDALDGIVQRVAKFADGGYDDDMCFVLAVAQ